MKNFFIICSLISVILLSGCCFSHEWDGGSCLESEKCTKCGEIHEGTEPKGHVATEWIIDKEVTFTEDGAKHTTCAECGIKYDESTESTGHNMSDWEKSLKFNEDVGTYSSEGIQFRKCSLCGYEETEKADLSVSEFESLARRLATECKYDDITFGETPDEYLKGINFFLSVISFTGKVMRLDYETDGICYANISQNSSGGWSDTIRLFMPNRSFSIGEIVKVYGVYWGSTQTIYGEIPNIQAVAVDR